MTDADSLQIAEVKSATHFIVVTDLIKDTSSQSLLTICVSPMQFSWNCMFKAHNSVEYSFREKLE